MLELSIAKRACEIPQETHSKGQVIDICGHLTDVLSAPHALTNLQYALAPCRAGRVRPGAESRGHLRMEGQRTAQA